MSDWYILNNSNHKNYLTFFILFRLQGTNSRAARQIEKKKRTTHAFGLRGHFKNVITNRILCICHLRYLFLLIVLNSFLDSCRHLATSKKRSDKICWSWKKCRWYRARTAISVWWVGSLRTFAISASIANVDKKSWITCKKWTEYWPTSPHYSKSKCPITTSMSKRVWTVWIVESRKIAVVVPAQCRLCYEVFQSFQRSKHPVSFSLDRARW